MAKEIGLVRVEPYSEAKHAEMSGNPNVMEEGDDFYVMNKTPATDAYLAEVRAQGVEMFMESDECSQEAYGLALHFAAQLRQDAKTEELVAAGIITRIEG